MVSTENTELKIIDAARKVFILKGMDGARMQEIADEAGINKALLHYYFRSKTKLFDRVFMEIFDEIAEVISKIVDESDNLEELIENFVENYISLVRSKPFVPDFVLHELNRNPQIIVRQIQLKGINLFKFMQIIDEAVQQKTIRMVNPIHLIVNILALTIFPFVAKPIIQGFMFGGDEDLYEQFIDQRSEQVISFIKASLFINPPEK